MKITENIQNLLPIGYLYLVVVGLLKETVLFYQLGINILKYSSIMDVLISPIATFTSHPIVFIVILSFIIFCYYLPSILYKNGHKKWIQKAFELKKSKEDSSDEEIINYYNFISIKTLAVTLFSIYFGFGMAQGYFTSQKFKNNKLHFDYKINFNSGESEQICLIETNSLYYFYVSKNEKAIKIAPIGGIKNIVLTNNKKLNE